MAVRMMKRTIKLGHVRIDGAHYHMTLAEAQRINDGYSAEVWCDYDPYNPDRDLSVYWPTKDKWAGIVRIDTAR